MSRKGRFVLPQHTTQHLEKFGVDAKTFAAYNDDRFSGYGAYLDLEGHDRITAREHWTHTFTERAVSALVEKLSQMRESNQNFRERLPIAHEIWDAEIVRLHTFLNKEIDQELDYTIRGEAHMRGFVEEPMLLARIAAAAYKFDGESAFDDPNNSSVHHERYQGRLAKAQAVADFYMRGLTRSDASNNSTRESQFTQFGYTDKERNAVMIALDGNPPSALRAKYPRVNRDLGEQVRVILYATLDGNARKSAE